MPDNVAARMRRYRQRQHEGRWVVQIETWPDLVDALEAAGFAPAGIETREDAEAAITAALLRWESSLDRLQSTDLSSVTRNADGNAVVVDHANPRGDDHDADENP